MAIFVKTKTPRMLVENIKKLIDEQKIDTWSVDSDNDFTHDVDQWRNKAWIRHKIEAGRVVFFVICRKGIDMTIVEYAVYHGRFVEMLLAHFNKECDAIEVSPLATSYDIMNWSAGFLNLDISSGIHIEIRLMCTRRNGIRYWEFQPSGLMKLRS